MNAAEFVNKFGVDEAVGFINETNGFGDVYCKDSDKYISVECSISDLKQIVDAWELVDKHGGIVNANTIAWKLSKAGLDTQADQMRKAINLVEQCK